MNQLILTIHVSVQYYYETICMNFQHSLRNTNIKKKIPTPLSLRDCSLKKTVHTEPRRAEHLQLVLHAAHRLQQDAEPERQVQQRQVAGLHEPDPADGRRQSRRGLARTGR